MTGPMPSMSSEAKDSTPTEAPMTRPSTIIIGTVPPPTMIEPRPQVMSVTARSVSAR